MAVGLDEVFAPPMGRWTQFFAALSQVLPVPVDRSVRQYRGSLMNRKYIYLLFVCLVSQTYVAVAAPQGKTTDPNSPCCKRPAFENMAEFRARACEGKRGQEFNGLAAKNGVLFDGMMACRALEGAWREYCTCWGKRLNANPVSNPKDLRFKVVDCAAKSPKANIWVYCGHFGCEEATSSEAASSSSSSSGLQLQNTLMCEYVP